jgi:hypothetical protein
MAYKQKNIIIMRPKKLLKNEARFAGTIGLWLSDELTDDQKNELEQMFSLDYGGLVNACNRYMLRTIKAIKKGYMSLDGFTIKDAEEFRKLLDSEKLDQSLQNELSHLLYGADERARYLD